MTTTSSHTGVGGGNHSDHIVSGLVEDRNKPKTTVRKQVDEAISLLTVRLGQLPEHGQDDATPEQEVTTRRIEKLRHVIKLHFGEEVAE